MSTPFEDFVNTELPRRITINQLPSNGNLPANKIPRSTGIGLQVEMVDYPTSGSNITFIKEEFIVDPVLESTKTITLSNSLNQYSETVSWNGIVLTEGLNNDYTVSGNTIIFNNLIELYVDDYILISYSSVL